MATNDRRLLDPEAMTPREFVTTAYGRWTPERMDLMHDMSATEGFVVDGEALLLEAFGNWNVQWPKGCGQLLHVVFNAERLLEEFTLRGSIFSIVFFDSNRALWARDPSKLLARDFVVRHLAATMPKIVHTFSSWWGDERWNEFLRVQLPSFIMTNDAEQLEHTAFPPDYQDEQTLEEARFMMRAFMVDCIVRRFHVVYSTRLVRKDSFIHGFVVRSSSKRFLPMGKEIDIAAIRAECDKIFGNSGSSALVAVEKDAFPAPGRFGAVGDGSFAAPAGLDGDALRVRLAAAALQKVLGGAAEFKAPSGADLKADLAKAYLLHALVLRELPISARAQQLTEQQQEEDELSPYFAAADGFFAAVMEQAARIAGSAKTQANDAKAAADGELCDAWDHRLFRKIIGVLLGSSGKLTGPEGLVGSFKRIWTAVSGSAPDTDNVLACKDGVPPMPAGRQDSQFALLPTEDTLVTQLLGELKVEEMPDALAQRTFKKMQDKRSWLQASQLWQAQDFDETVKSDDLFKAVQAAYADAYDTSNVSALKKRKMEARMERSRMKFLHSIQSGAESMSGGFLPQQDSKVVSRDSDKSKKVKLGAKAAEIAEKNRAQLEQKEKENQERAWSNFYAKLEVKKEVSPEKLEVAAREIQRLVAMKKTLRDPVVLIKARVERLKLLERVWLSVSKDPETKEKKMDIAVDLFRGVHELIKQYLERAKAFKARAQKVKEQEADPKHGKQKKKKEEEEEEKQDVYTPLFGDEEMQILRRILVMLGLKENCKRVDKEVAKADGVEYQKEGRHKLPSSSATSKSARVIAKDAADANSRSHVRFQMGKMGHLFDRSTGDEDPRVVFKPDPWQKEMLDAVDRRDSILCSAPTSAGKTFISYYCMKEVIFSSKDDVVVYVAPTRALCNQAAQDVYSIFSNKKYSESGWSLFGILGGGTYVQPLPPMGGPFMTQVLITIPSVFEHVMLAPKYQQWAKRVKYVIFDEVHCVDTSAEGHLWERLLMCTRAPFLALSATVGNFDMFKEWLERTQELVRKQDEGKGTLEQRAYKVKGVFWNQRWNDLRKFIYLPRTVEQRSAGVVRVHESGSGRFGSGHVQPLHPFSTVTRTMLEKLGQFPQDLPLVPEESLQLYDSMSQAFEAVSRMLIGSWSDDEGNRIRFDSEKVFSGRRGAFKGLNGAVVTGDMPKVPAQEDFEDYEPKACFTIEGGHVWVRVNDDDSLEAVMQKGGKVSCFEMEHEIDGDIIESMQEDGCLSPESFFEKDIAITQLRAREYEKALKDGFMSWVEKGETDLLARMMVDRVMASLGGGLRQICSKAETIADEQEAPLDTKEFIEKNFTDLLLCLNSEGLLPALVFNFDQSVCEDLARMIVTQLEQAEDEYKKTPEWKAFVKRRTDQMNQQKRQVKAFQAAKSGKRDEEGSGEKELVDEPELVDCSIPDILPAYAFCHGDRGDGLKKDDLERLLKELENDLERNHFLIHALERGIGVHHAGLPTKYRNNVEKLFRLKKLKVVVATDGLALGIHSPCRTVVLAGDDVQLSTMHFRQMSGRAGRRGQDFIGHVVFYGIPEAKIVRLMTSGLPTLQGHMSIDTTTVLRMSLLHSFAAQNRGRDRIEVDQWRVKAMSQCMMESMFTLGKKKAQARADDSTVGEELYKKLLRLQWRYSTDYLQREGLIQPTGTGLFLPGLVTRALYSNSEVHMNPPNLVFAALLKRGVFQKNTVCGQYTRKENASIVAQMSKFLATLFSVNGMGWKQEIHRSIRAHPDVMNEECPHDVVLSPINELFGGEIWKTLKQYTDETLEIFSDLAKRMGEEAELAHGKDDELPLSAVSFAREFEASGLLKELADQASVVKARSPFVAVSGLGDRFHCVDDLCQTLRSGLHLEEDSLPLLDFIDLGRRDPHDRWVTINAAAFDYVMEGAQTVDGQTTRLYLQELNGLSQSLSWMVLNRYFTAVTNITDLVERLAPAWKKIDQVFTCCNTLCPPETKRFTSEKGLYKCHECDLNGIDTYMCPKCYEEGEECVTQQDDKYVKNKSHVFFRHVYDRFVQTMSHIAADLDPLNKELGRSQRTTTRRKKKQYENVNVKPKRPILQRPQRRGATLFVTSHKRK